MRFRTLTHSAKISAYWQWYYGNQADIRSTSAGDWLRKELAALDLTLDEYVFIHQKHRLILIVTNSQRDTQVITMSPAGITAKPEPLVGIMAITMASLYLDFLRLYREPATKAATMLSLFIFFYLVADTHEYNAQGRTIAVD